MKTQREAVETFLPEVEKKGHTFEKFVEVDARSALLGEKIVTVTSDGKETENTAKDGDFVVRNVTGAGEEYILTAKQMASRYERLGAQTGAWGRYRANGKCMAIRYYGPDTEFMAAWGSPMALKNGDMICTPLPEKGEIYRIAAKEFTETYRLCGAV